MTERFDKAERFDKSESFDENGFVIVRNFLPPSEAKALKDIASHDAIIADNAYERLDKEGRKSKVTLWYVPGDDVFDRLSCSDRMLSEMSDILGGEACFFHAKLMQKEPQSGGAWEWHQDYGYWYDDGFLKGDMASCYVALEAATRENGCLKVIPGSHKYGRLRHETVGEQAGAEKLRVELLQKRHGVSYCELEPGDALYFHSNLLHASGPNLSVNSRWGLIASFFRHDNESYLDDPRFRKKVIPVVPHSEILQGTSSANADKSFLKINS